MVYRYTGIPAAIRAVGAHIPARTVGNGEILGSGKDDAALRRLLGAVSRHAAEEHEHCSDLIARAGAQVLERAGVEAGAVQRLLVSATPGDYLEPCAAALVQHKLGLACPAMDVGMSCVGWVAAMDHALRCLATGERNVLVLAGTVVSDDRAYRTPAHRAIFGDGAGGVLLDRSDDGGRFLAGALHTLGEHHGLIRLKHQFSPPRPGDGSFPGFSMEEGSKIRDVLAGALRPAVDEILAVAGVGLDEIDVVMLHQASGPLFEEAVKLLGVPRHKVVEDYERYGNTISAELPISLNDCIASGRLQHGDLALMVTFGAGFSGGCLLFRY